MEDKIDSIISKLHTIDMKLELHIQDCKNAFSRIAELDEKQNVMLEDHMARSDALEEQNKLSKTAIDVEIAKLKKPREAIQWLFGLVVGLSAFLSALVYILEKLKVLPTII